MLTHTRRALLAATCCLLLAPATVAAQTTTTNRAAFLAGVGVSGNDTFDDLEVGPVVGPLARTAGTFGYSVASTSAAPFDNLFALDNPTVSGDRWLSLEDAIGSLTFSGFASNVIAIGGQFFATNLDGATSGTTIRVQATDVMGTSIDELLTPTSATTFFGVRFDHALASLTLTAEGSVDPDFFFATVNDLVLAEARAVPEPHAAWLIAAGIVLVLARSRHRQRA
jgi:hypothetical protein